MFIQATSDDTEWLDSSNIGNYVGGTTLSPKLEFTTDSILPELDVKTTPLPSFSANMFTTMLSEVSTTDNILNNQTLPLTFPNLDTTPETNLGTTDGNLDWLLLPTKDTVTQMAEDGYQTTIDLALLSGKTFYRDVCY